VTGYSRSPKLLKGALIQFTSALIVPIPNIIVFQYNPESLSRSLTPYDPQLTDLAPPSAPAAGAETGAAAAVPSAQGAQPFDPAESFTLNLVMDASDALEAPESHPVAFVTGVADRLAAIEMLLYPIGDDGGLEGLLNISVSVSIGSGGLSVGGKAAVSPPPQRREAPIVLFVWGPGRIVPVRLTSFTIEEQAFNQLLYPVRAKASLGLRILTDQQIEAGYKNSKQKLAKGIAKTCYMFTRTQKQVLATANLANSVESILGMLPF
jgi:hypothetical protein